MPSDECWLPFKSLVPRSVMVGEGEIASLQAPLSSDEESFIAGRALSALRLRELRAGRACAGAALRQLGYPSFIVRAGEDRAPIWPRDVVGSITHSSQYCAAVAAPRATVEGLGIDCEVVGIYDENVWRRIYLPREVESFCGEADFCEVSYLIFSAKESVYKAIYPSVRRFVDYLEVEIVFGPEGRFGVRGSDRCIDAVVSPIEGRYLISKDSVFTCAFRKN
jgi:4'-phosphopantetheinyl transferase EntD